MREKKASEIHSVAEHCFVAHCRWVTETNPQLANISNNLGEASLYSLSNDHAMFKRVLLMTSIFDLSEELKGFTHVKFLDWDPNIAIGYSTGDKRLRPIYRGTELKIGEDLFLHKEGKLNMRITLDLR